MMTATGQAKDGLSFGPFNLLVKERLLTRESVPVELGARALDILIVLSSRPNEVVSKKDLISQVWPDVTVEESSLRFHMVGLRKALGDGKNGARYITTLVGRGYCFVAPISPASSPIAPVAAAAAANFPHVNLPSRISRTIGRDDDIIKLSAHLTASRFVTIVGSGGVGKTTVAVAVAHHLVEAFAGSVLFVDLGMLRDPNLAATAVASMLGLSVQSDDVRPSLIAYLRDKRILLVLDTCEHLIESVAALAANIVEAAPEVHILATSREALRSQGEHVYRLDALACPPDAPGFTAAAVENFPATQLFVERALASGAHLVIGDAEAPIVASICRKLDGVALAIELAARRVESYGLRQTAALLEQRLALLWQGSRTAPPRQKTLQATFDWSYELLSDLERAVLRRLAVFVGHFTLDAALEVVTSATIDRTTIFNAIDSLVEKSMVAARPIGAMMRYRLLDTTRAYALETRMDDSELTDLAVRHATYYRRWLVQTGTEWTTLSTATGTERARYFTALNNVRAALEWCFGANGNLRVGIELASAAAPVFVAMSLLPECHRWSERAILALDDTTRGGAHEMHLQAGLGISSMHLHGKRDATRAALQRGVAIAEERADALNQIGLLSVLRRLHFLEADFKTALQHAERCRAVAETIEDPAAVALAHSMLGRSLHVMGDLNGARIELETCLQHWARAERTTTYLAHEFHYPSDITLARTLWLQGHPTQALERAHQVIKKIAHSNHPALLTVVVGYAASVLLWAGDLERATDYIDSTMYLAERNSLGPILAVGRARRAELAIRLGDTEQGIENLRSSLQAIHAAGYELLVTEFNISLVQGLAAAGQFPEGVMLVDQTIRRVETNGDTVYMPELLRVKGSLLLSGAQRRVEEAEMCFARSLELSRSHGSRAWELRTATDLAALWAGQGRSDDAGALLLPVYKQFTEGLETADLKAAERLLATLN